MALCNNSFSHILGSAYRQINQKRLEEQAILGMMEQSRQISIWNQVDLSSATVSGSEKPEQVEKADLTEKTKEVASKPTSRKSSTDLASTKHD